jgi:uncharacterized protein YrrD
MPVIVTNEGREIGRVADVLFDPVPQTLAGLFVDMSDDTDTRLYVDRDDIVGLGRDAVTVARSSVVHPYAADQRARRIVESGVRLSGATVMTEGGDAIGTIDRVILDNEGSIAGYGTRSGRIPLRGKHTIDRENVLSVGADAVVVSGTTHRRSSGKHR